MTATAATTPSAVQDPSTAAVTPSTGPLTEIKVLDVSTVYAAPITAMLLGDLGADVLKVEHPRGGPARTHGWNREGRGLWWKVIARNRRTATLNFGKPDGAGRPPRGTAGAAGAQGRCVAVRDGIGMTTPSGRMGR
jgi:hypothetical protein